MLLRASVVYFYSGLRASRRVCRSLGGSLLCDCFPVYQLSVFLSRSYSVFLSGQKKRGEEETYGDRPLEPTSGPGVWLTRCSRHCAQSHLGPPGELALQDHTD